MKEEFEYSVGFEAAQKRDFVRLEKRHLLQKDRE